ncbi:hypothetical protein PV325_003914 [Microctonus aethiopoides]|nr:hypothetical protein PV325_003914 [Microctonus aethiopoides]
MSSGNKSLVYSGGKGTNKNKSQQHGKSDHHSKTTDSAKHDKGQSNKDQTKHAQIIDTRSGGIEDPVLKEQIKQAIEVTRRSEDEVIMALHDSDWDFDRAVNDLLEGVSTEWEVKKKKPRQPSGSKQSADPSVDHDESGGGDWDERRNQRSGGPPRLRGRANHDNRGWRGRENKENERNMEDNVREGGGGYGGGRRGRGGSGRSGRGGRGGGRGLGPRAYASRGDTASSSGAHSFNRPIDTWTGSEEQQQSNQESKIASDPWNNLEPAEDWDNEEYTGSLADTKVFTPSTSTNDQSSDETKNSSDTSALTTVQSGNIGGLPQEELAKLSDGSGMQSQQTAMIQPQSQQSQQSSVTQQQTLGMPTSMQLSQQSSTLTAAQSQYLTQLTQQSSENYKGTGQPAFSSMTISNLPQRQVKQRPRAPPPSKIPSSAVEMPGDTVNSGIGLLDVQFGALEFGNDTTSVDATNADKYNSSSTNISGIDVSSNVVAASAVTNSTTTSSNTLDIDTAQQSGSYNTSSQMIASPNNTGVNYGNNTGTTSATYQSQKTSYQTSNNAPSSYNAYSSSTGGQSVVQSSYSTSTGGNTNSYTPTTPVTQTGYSATSSYPQSNASTFSQASPSASSSTGASGYNQTTTTNQVYQSSSGFVPATTGQYQVPQSTNPGANNNNTGGYQTTSYQGSSSFQSTPQVYQPSVTTFTSPITQASSSAYQSAAHSVYGSVYSTYNNQSQVTSHNHAKLNSGSGKDSQYDNTATTSTGSLATTSAPSLGLSSASVNSSQTKVTSSNVVPKSTSSGSTATGAGGSGSITGASSAGGAASNMTPMLGHQYIVGQSMPYAAFQQPMYSYEDLQLMQQRIPHMPTTGYYDAALGYQTTAPATSLGGGRNDALSGVQGVQGVQGAYTSMSDGRFARNDSNASPVPSTMSQQTATQHQQPMLNAPLPPGYAYFYGAGIMPPGSFQYSGPAIYPVRILLKLYNIFGAFHANLFYQ